MSFRDYLAGRVKCRVVSASLESAINRMSLQCDILNLEIVDDLTATFWVRGSDLHLVKEVNERIDVEEYTGFYWQASGILHRPIIIIGMALLLLLIFYLPTRVLFISVYGNNDVAETLILDEAQKCGVSFGASREHVKSEEVKNTLLQSIPQLQWACINTKGCVAEIFVQERDFDIHNKSVGVSDIVASSDGIITGITVFRGTPLCKVGQIVKKGQLLVSGYSDLGLLIKSEAAKAEILAETTRNVAVVALTEYTHKEVCKKKTGKYSLQIGKKLIKFYKDSGISPPGCGRINKIYQLTLPGGYCLPISLVKEQIYCYDTTTCIDTKTDSFDWLRRCADSVVKGQMIAGYIIKKSEMLENNGQFCRLTAHYRCNEMIAISQVKEKYTIDGKRN